MVENIERSVADMKKRSLIIALLLTVTMVMFGTASVFADVSGTDYKYTVTVYAGQQGHFENPTTGKVSKDKKILTITAGLNEMVTIDQTTTGFKLDNGEYYLRGFRQTGHDNDEEMSATSFPVDQDISYEAAYGLKGGMVKYTVHYLNENKKELRKAEEFYGMIGDKHVVSYRYVEGYQPNAYNLKKTLSANEATNVFEFIYSKNPTVQADNGGGGNAGGGAANGGGAAGGGAAAGNGANAGAGAGTANIGDNATPAAVVDLDDNQTPMAGNSGGGSGTTVLPDGKTPSAGISPIAIGGGIALLVIIAAIAAVAFALTRRRQDEEDKEAAYEESPEQV